MNSLSGFTMGTSYSIQIADELDSSTLDALAKSIQSTLDHLDKDLLSTYAAGSELSKFNQSQTKQLFSISKELAEVVFLAQEINKFSDGAFDITIGPLVNLWGFGTKKERDAPPSQALINTALLKLGNDDLEVSLKDLSLSKNKAVEIDLSAVAKGYAVDQLAELLTGEGVENYLVEIGGELLVAGNKAEVEPWVLGIELPESPNNQSSTLAFDTISSNGASIAIASSGDYRNYFDYEGKRFSHEISPYTGWPVSQDLVSVTVISETAARADALATAFIIMGFDKGMEIAGRENIAVYFIISAPSGFQSHYTNAFAPFLSKASTK